MQPNFDLTQLNFVFMQPNSGFMCDLHDYDFMRLIFGFMQSTCFMQLNFGYMQPNSDFLCDLHNSGFMQPHFLFHAT